MNKIGIGSIVELIDSYANCYYKYEEWIGKHCPQYLPMFVGGKVYNNGIIGEVVCIAPFGGTHNEPDIYAIKTDDSIYLVKREAIISCNNFKVELL
jgi:hypothetical protein